VARNPNQSKGQAGIHNMPQEKNMNRLYVLPKSVWSDTQVKTGEHHENGHVTELFVHIHHIFSQKMGSHYIDLSNAGLSNADLSNADLSNPGLSNPDLLNDPSNGLILMTTAFDPSETQDFETLFHGHPDVAVLPHPTTMGHVKLVDHVGDPVHKYQHHHHQALLDLPGLDLHPDDTVIDLHRKAARLNPALRLRNVL
jgi:hypothetical protein